MELTTDNLIKIAIGVFVIVVMILGIYFAMNSYVIPYFSGIGFEEPKIDANSEFGKELLKDENLIGSLDEDRYLVLKGGEKTEIYFPKGENGIYLREYTWSYNKDSWGITNWVNDHLNGDKKIGSWDSNGGKITIQDVQYEVILNNAYRNGEKEIRRIK